MRAETRLSQIPACFLDNKHIDSYQKLRVLLFLYQHPWLKNKQQLIERLYFGDTPLLDEIIGDLRRTGLLECDQTGCRLCNDVEVKTCLQQLADAFEDPLIRQQLLEQINH